MYTTPNLSLVAWDLDGDGYNGDDLVNNWIAIDLHNHTAGHGASLPRDAIPILGQEHLEPCSVNTIQLCDNAITSPKLQSDSITSPKIQDGAVTSTKIGNKEVKEPNLDDGAVSTRTLSNLSVITPKLGNNAVTTPKLGDNSVNAAKLSNNAVITDKVDDGAVTNPKLANSSVSATKIAPNSVSSTHIQDRTVAWNDEASRPAIRLVRFGNLNIPNQSDTFVTFDNINYNTGAELDLDMLAYYPGQIRIPVAGIYMITGGVRWFEPSGVTGKRMIRILYNNGTYIAGEGPYPQSPGDIDEGNNVRFSVATAYACDVGDAIGLTAWQNSGATKIITGGHHTTHLSATWMSAL